MATSKPEQTVPAPRLPAVLRLRGYANALAELARTVRERRVLAAELAKRGLLGEHSGHALGAFWGVAQPLFLMFLYAFIFGVVFRVKVGGTFELPRDFTVYMLAGLVPWLAFQTSLLRATSSISGNANLVKQVVFEVSLLPLSAALAALVPLVLGLAFVAVYTLAADGALPWTYALLPVVVLLQLGAMAGFGFALAAIGAFFRDVRELVQMFVIAAIFLMPIVYLPGSVPGGFDEIIWANPFTYMVWCYQDVLYFGRIEHPWAWVVFAGLSVVSLAAGYRLFRRVRPYFANVL
jgi:lipopolysaccharide transport system permease protein